MPRHLLLPTLSLVLAHTALSQPEEAPAIQLPDPANDLPASDTPPPSTNVTVNLINRLVEKGILTQVEAAALIQQAEADAATARNAAAPAVLPPAPAPEDEARIAYVPEVVRNELRDGIRQELMAQAREENWSKTTAADWTSKFRPFGDIRTRYEDIFYGEGNDPNAGFTNFNAINNGIPYDSTNPLNQLPPLYNVEENRNRTRLRARFGSEIMLGEGFNAGIRLATGENDSPVSPNQTMGGGSGNFSKYPIWLDRALLSYDAGPGDGEELLFLLGRFENPFFSSEVQWDNDVGFDGLAVRGRVKTSEETAIFFTAGYFPIFNTELNFASNQADKFKSTDKWLTGAQVGVDWKIQDDLTAKLAVAYYDFDAIEGKLSDPFVPLSPEDIGNTDSTRTLFSQRGNTYMPLRNITPTAANGFGTTNQFQYYGLASEFENLTLTGRLDYDGYEPLRLSLLGELTKNIAFDRNQVAARAYSNGRPGRTLNTPGEFEGGDLAWNLNLQFGSPTMEKFGDWAAILGYRYVESDAVVDGFTDSRFGGGGTNLQGFILGGDFAVSSAVLFAVRWMSADEIDGPPLAIDSLQIDLNASF